MQQRDDSNQLLSDCSLSKLLRFLTKGKNLSKNQLNLDYTHATAVFHSIFILALVQSDCGFQFYRPYSFDPLYI